MKYCTKCGNELFDYAVVCTKCGCMVDQSPINASQQVGAPQGISQDFTRQPKSSSFLPEIFNFIFDLFVILSGLIFGWAFSEAWINASANLSQYYGISVYAYMYYDSMFFTFALIAAITAVILAITSLIVALVNKCETKMIFDSVKRIVLGSALILLSLLFLVF